MGFGVFPTIISCVVSAVLAMSLTMLFMRNSKSLNENKCDVCHLRRGKEGTAPCGERKTISTPRNLELVVLRDAAVRHGAVCLDGSAPGYYFKKGHGNGQHRWILHFEGGAWCSDNQSCYQRSHSKYGSLRYTNYKSGVPKQGLYSRDRRTNPDFYNWNMVFVIYCDGSSFTGMRTNPVYFKNKTVYFRGMLILRSVINDLLNRGVRNARDVLLIGSSAGSLAVLIHADSIKSKLPRGAKLRAVSDSGYFVDLKTQCGVHKAREMFRGILTTHNSTSGLHERCVKHTAVDQRWKCLFPQYFFKFIQTPVFVLQSAYDVWQIPNYLDIVCTIPDYNDLTLFNSLDTPVHGTVHVNDLGGRRKKREARHGGYNSSGIRTLEENVIKRNFHPWHWQGLYSKPAACTKVETKMILSIRGIVLEALKPVLSKKQNGLFLSSCFEHTQAPYDQIWKKVKIRGKTIRQAIHEWYFEKPGNHFHIAKPFSFASCMP